MFGGYGFFRGDGMFVPPADRLATTPNHRVPDDLLGDAETITLQAESAFAAAIRAGYRGGARKAGR